MELNIFERQESKYMVTANQMNALLDLCGERLCADKYYRYEIRSIYFDTGSYDLIRASIEAPVYKEKLRMRSYGRASDDANVFIELKKKYRGIVYKRRADLTLNQAKVLLIEGVPPRDTQILREVAAFRARLHVMPKAFISYDRTAFCGVDDPELRVTFDSNIHFRTDDLRLDSTSNGDGLLDGDAYLMEIKIVGAFPLWLSAIMSLLQIYPTSFSKYGMGYKRYILPSLLCDGEEAFPLAS
ncbi:molecular chaperone [Clostridia bacterium]|nr:molecular chaperone [Clostridia bacterium]